MTKHWVYLSAGILWVAAAACEGDSGAGISDAGGASGATEFIRSGLQRAPATRSEATDASEDTQQFAWDFYRQIAGASKNSVFSPYSISVAAAMLSAGAEGKTLSEMQTALAWSTDPQVRHQSHNALAQELDARNHEATEETNAQILRSSNDFWMLPELRPGDAFMDTLAVSYGAGVHLADFAAEPEPSRAAINRKVSDDTRGLIAELLPQGSITSATVFVLSNALYFKARWAHEFNEDMTTREPFNSANGSTPDVDMMHQAEHFDYVEGDGYRAASLPYFGAELDLVVILPSPGTFPDFVRGLDAAAVRGILEGLTERKLDLWMPKFEIHGDIPLKAELQKAGMVQAFEAGSAEFRPIAEGVFISEAFHQATLIVDEEGTEAAAATAFVGSRTSAPPPEEPVLFKIDHPFVFLLRDRPTNAPLFVGHFATP